MATRRGLNGSNRGRAVLAAKRERDIAASSDDKQERRRTEQQKETPQPAPGKDH